MVKLFLVILNNILLLNRLYLKIVIIFQKYEIGSNIIPKIQLTEVPALKSG
jgi:hypothetical protein